MNATPTQMRLHQERMDRMSRLRVAAASVKPKNRPMVVSMLPSVPPKPIEWPEYHEPVAYELGEYDIATIRRLSARKIIEQVLLKYGLTKAELTSSRRAAHIVAARREASWRMRHEWVVMGRQASLPEIARSLGGLDHTTVLHHIRKHEAQLRAQA